MGESVKIKDSSIDLDFNDANQTRRDPLIKRRDDRWEGEDEDDEVKDNWDEDDEEEEEPAPKIIVPKKKPLEVRIKEKEEKKRLELEEKRKKLEEANKVKTSEEILADKDEKVRLQMEADLQLAKEALGGGVGGDEKTTGIDGISCESKEDFDKFRQLLVDKMQSLEKSPLYIAFLEATFRDICVPLEVDDIKRMSSCLNALWNEKLKAQKVNIKAIIYSRQNALHPLNHTHLICFNFYNRVLKVKRKQEPNRP